MKPVIVWDMGGIIYRYFTEMILELGHRSGWPVDQIPLGPTHDVPDPEYAAMDRGELTEPEYLDDVVGRLASIGVSLDPPRDLEWADQLRPEVRSAIDRLRDSGYRQAVLTNDASRWLGDGWWERWELAGSFDVLIDISMIGVRKPAPEPYLAAADSLGVAPDQCLFVDDMHCNCAGAEAVGMRAMWFDVTDPETSIRRLFDRLTSLV